MKVKEMIEILDKLPDDADIAIKFNSNCLLVTIFDSNYGIVTKEIRL